MGEWTGSQCEGHATVSVDGRVGSRGKKDGARATRRENSW